MKRYLKYLLTKLAQPLAGKGLVDRHIPFALRIYQRIYAAIQTENVKEVTIPLNCKLTVFTKDIGIGFPLLTTGRYEPLQTKMFLESLQEENVVIDIGANVGYYTVLAASKVGPRGRVFSFEPDPENFHLLQENVKRNAYKNVTLEMKAVANTDGNIAFSMQRTNKGESAISSMESETTNNLPAIRIDTYLKKSSLQKPTCIKIDIEGAELEALKGMEQTIMENNQLTLFIEYNPSRIMKYHHAPENLLQLLRALGFRIETIIDETRALALPYTEETLLQTMSHATYCNLLCSKKVI